ncbi:MAG: GMP synthase subunit A, partial [Candidatus Poseidoniales archaeon]
FQSLTRASFMTRRLFASNMSDVQLVIDVVDNGGQWTHREWRMLRYLDVNTKILSNKTPLSEFRQVDGLILSGGAARVGLTGELGNCAEYFELDVPILGICAGHQFMADFYGGSSREALKPEFGEATITLVNGGGRLFQSTPTKQMVWESHNDEVIELPKNFTITAFSPSCQIQAMENEFGNRFGVQFHPEVDHSEYGQEIFSNFVKICKSSKN